MEEVRYSIMYHNRDIDLTYARELYIEALESFRRYSRYISGVIGPCEEFDLVDFDYVHGMVIDDLDDLGYVNPGEWVETFYY